jgi:hypothetical protein
MSETFLCVSLRNPATVCTFLMIFGVKTQALIAVLTKLLLVSHILCDQLLCRKCFRLANTFKFVTSNILFQPWKLMINTCFCVQQVPRFFTNSQVASTHFLTDCCSENQNASFMLNNFFENRALYNIEKCGGVRGAKHDVTIYRIRVVCWINKATCIYAHAHAQAHGNIHVRAHTTHKNI